MPDEGKSMDHCEDASIHIESTGEYLATFITFNFEETSAIDLIWIERVEFEQTRYAEEFTLKTYWFQEPPPPNEVKLADIQTFLI